MPKFTLTLTLYVGESLSESASLATDLDLAAEFPPLVTRENFTVNNSGNGQSYGTCDEEPSILTGNRAPSSKAVWPNVKPTMSTSDSTAVIENNINTNTIINENVNNNASENYSYNAVAR